MESDRVVVTRANMEAALADVTRKQAFVTPLFNLIAPQYDRFTRAFSYGMDARWKEQLTRWVRADAAESPRLHVLDVACGTGDLSLAVARSIPTALVTGIDVSERMLTLARARADLSVAGRLRFKSGDLTRLDLPPGSMDAVTAGYALRNVPDPREALGELARVLRRRGHLYVLDFFRPASALWRGLYLGYLRAAGAAVGWWWHRAPAAYEYIAASVQHFVSQEEFSRWLTEAGFEVQRTQQRVGGGVALIAARKR